MTRLLSYYGDDFTGSTDVMEALATHGIDTVLFTRLPGPAEFAPFASYPAIGLAGTSRSETPAWMSEALPPIFAWLKSLDARFCHYKVCSTFDSSPMIGSIGRAAEIGAACFAQALIPLVVGAPQLKRYTFAAHLFAAYQGAIYRIDRHPVMSRHPVTPMDESDLRLHLARQTGLPVVLAGTDWPSRGIALLDVHDDATQLVAGRRLLALPSHAAPFVIGSSGVEYALMRALADAGTISGRAAFAPLARVEQTMVVSGSVSPTTERQIRHALAQGFEAVPISAVALACGEPQVMAEAVERSLGILQRGRSPLVHTALGAATDEGARIDASSDGRRNIGEGLGRILGGVLARTGLSRVMIAGGDTSSHALGQLDIFALTTRHPLPATPGSPLCNAASALPRLNGLEIALKGGQVGGDDYFVRLRDGRV
ncbi:MAG: four-carbon acid sugar kinase family protein [Aestuariivirga sp.]